MSDQEMHTKMHEIMKRMKNRREELNMSYQNLSEKVGISKSTLQRYETGYIKNMPVDKLEEFAKALEISPSYLMGWEERTEPSTTAAHKDGENFTPEELNKIEEYKKLLVAARPKE